MGSLAGSLALIALVLAAVPAHACSGKVGEQVILASLSPDPDVFIWDSRPHLVDYAAGTYLDAKNVMNHTTLARPGTRALVTECHEAEIHQKYIAEPLDAVGVKVMSGPYLGRFGWVSSEEIHALRGAHPSPTAAGFKHT